MAESVAICNYVRMDSEVRDFPRDACAVASTLEAIGERWTVLILREAFFGVRRFEDLHRNIGAARNILSDRLNTLVAKGILRRELYNERPPRYEYRLTRKGVDLWGIVIELARWGQQWAPNDDGPAVVLRHRACGHVGAPVHTCADCGEQVHAWDLEPLPGPAMTSRQASAG